MFCYDNGKVCVLAMPRCGHTSMTGYFGFIPHNGEHQDWSIWHNTTSRRVVVLRNPFDRLRSALYTLNPTTEKDVIDDEWNNIHSGPYLHLLGEGNFDIIPFENLKEYIYFHRFTVFTKANNATYEIDYTAEMRKEYEIYSYLRRNCNIISPEEWQMATACRGKK